MKTFKVGTILLLNVVFLLGSWHHSESCGWYPEENDAWRFFDATLAQQPTYRPLYFSFDRLYSYDWDKPEYTHNENLQTWQSHFTATYKRDIPLAAIRSVIYQTNLTDLTTIKEAINNKNASIPASFEENQLVQLWQKKGEIDYIDYLILAKQCEPYAVEGNRWDNEELPVAERTPMQALIKEASTRSEQVREEELKLRYAYQAVRMAHYAGDYRSALTLFDRLVGKEPIEHLIYYWTLGHKAGALRRLGTNDPQAAYWFSLMFDKTTSKRINAYYSFHIDNEKEWQKTLAYCKNANEKATLYFLRGIKPYSNALEEMKMIRLLAPMSPYLDVLLVRELAKLEKELVPNAPNYPAASLAYLQSLKQFVVEIVRKGNRENKALWILALGYCDYMKGDTQAARNTLKNLPTRTLTPQVKRQMQIFELMLQLSELKQLDAATEERLYQEIEQTQYKPLKNLMIRTFHQWYEKQEAPAKAYLSYHGQYDLDSKPTLEMIEAVLSLMKQSSFTAYEKELLAKVKSEAYLLEMKATMLLRAGKLKEAKKLLLKLGDEQLTKRTGGPITTAYIKDCLSCHQGETYTRLDFINTVEALSKQATQQDKVAAEAYLKLGNAYYNITYFSHAWQLMAFFRSGSSMTEYDYTNCEKPLEYYKQAIALASRLGLKELAAEATMMAAKCEQNQYYLAKGKKRSWEYTTPTYTTYRTYFQRLRTTYSTTFYYQKALNECFYFDHYVGR